ncbi:MAG: dihydroorotate oxidase [Colwellia sp.]
MNKLLSSNIAGVSLPGYVLNASGPKCTSKQELIALSASESAAIMTKSCTVSPREGNSKPRYKAFGKSAIQSMGLPNLGYQAYLEMIPELKQTSKPLIISVSGISLEDNVTMMNAFQRSNADLIEVNFSCPNIIGKPQVGYDFEQSKRMLDAISSIGDIPFGIKLPPYFDFSHFEGMADILKQFPVKFITTINSIGNTLVIDPVTEKPIIKPKKGFGGLCGEFVKPIGLANVKAFRDLLPESIQIMGVGGIATGTDAFEYLLAGADAVQVAHCFQEEGVDCFTRINTELTELLDSKGYKDLSQVKGKLKDFDAG